ncbi:nitroreductase [Sphingomonas gilva]|uniref:Putative NAD(P)H nitroreductase n=1 Tax=Sphingomonas gilva TaxID=2305907 RepID=A0A396RVU2_9SPHN|nr:nitroreductase [Sphingomonas gilva]RHW17801.1 nitroreductase [Sphingomonas gilva]
MVFNDTSSPLSLIATRRSGKPRDMIAPGPTAAEMDAILALALRTPDHGKLAPWRFVVIEDRDALEALFVDAYLAEKPDAGRLEIEAMENMARQGPALVVALSSPQPESHIPLWEQQLSCGAACMNLLSAAHAHGFVGCWLTGWPAYSDKVRDAFGGPHERIAGFLYIGTPGREPEERPRPDFDAAVSRWGGPTKG